MSEISETDSTTEEIITEAISGINNDDLDIDSVTKLLCAQRLAYLEEKAQDEFGQLRSRQLRIRLLHNLTRAINSSSDSKGNLEFNKVKDAIAAATQQLNAELDKLLEKFPPDLVDKVKKANPGSDRPNLQQLRDFINSERDPQKSKELKALLEKYEQDIAEVEDVLKAVEGLKDSKGKPKTGNYNKEERDRWIEILKTTGDDLSMLHQMQIQTVNRLNNERNETLLMARTIMKTLHEDKLSKARSIAGR